MNGINYVALGNGLQDLVKKYNRTQNWMDLCDQYGAWLEAGIANADDLIRGKRPPSKDHKHRMYADAYRVLRLMGGDDRRLNNLDDIGQVIVEARRVMAGRIMAQAAEREAVAA